MERSETISVERSETLFRLFLVIYTLLILSKLLPFVVSPLLVSLSLLFSSLVLFFLLLLLPQFFFTAFHSSSPHTSASYILICASAFFSHSLLCCFHFLLLVSNKFLSVYALYVSF